MYIQILKPKKIVKWANCSNMLNSVFSLAHSSVQLKRNLFRRHHQLILIEILFSMKIKNGCNFNLKNRKKMMDINIHQIDTKNYYCMHTFKI